MPTVFRNCKVCGKEYPYCKTVIKDDTFRWQDVACCPEHGSVYLAQILESRGVAPAKDVIAGKEEVKDVNDFSDLVEDEEDELFEEDFEDEDDEAE